MNTKASFQPAWAKAAWVRASTLLIMAAMIAAPALTLYRLAATDAPSYAYSVSIAGYALLWVLPLMALVVFIWRKAGHMDGTWGR